MGRGRCDSRRAIVYVGDAAGAEQFKGVATEVIDIGNGLLLPGLIDSHTHFQWILCRCGCEP